MFANLVSLAFLSNSNFLSHFDVLKHFLTDIGYNYQLSEEELIDENSLIEKLTLNINIEFSDISKELLKIEEKKYKDRIVDYYINSILIRDYDEAERLFYDKFVVIHRALLSIEQYLTCKRGKKPLEKNEELFILEEIKEAEDIEDFLLAIKFNRIYNWKAILFERGLNLEDSAFELITYFKSYKEFPEIKNKLLQITKRKVAKTPIWANVTSTTTSSTANAVRGLVWDVPIAAREFNINN